MEIVIVILGIILLLTGIIFSIFPPLPGPLIAYLSLVLLLFHNGASARISSAFMLWMAFAVIAVMVLDYLTQIWGTKLTGGSSAGVWGTFAGLLAGILFLPAVFGPFAILIGPFLGAVIFELAAGRDFNKALRSGMGAFLGFVAGIVLKLVLCGYISYKFIAFIV